MSVRKRFPVPERLPRVHEQRSRKLPAALAASVLGFLLGVVFMHWSLRDCQAPLQVTFSPPPDARIADLKPVIVTGRRQSRGVVHIDRLPEKE